MATNNLKKFQKGLFNRGLQGQIILGNSKNGNNVSAIIVSGYKFDRLCNMTGEDVDMLLDDIACNVKSAYEMHVSGRNSHATQKVEKAHGRTDSEVENNQNKQDMTYCNVCANIQHYNRTWQDVLKQVVTRDKAEKTSLNNWIESMRGMHGDSFKKVIAKNANKNIFLIDGYIYNRYAFEKNLERYGQENFNRKLNKVEIDNMIKMFVTNKAVVA